jgi:hypothetical protein
MQGEIRTSQKHKNNYGPLYSWTAIMGDTVIPGGETSCSHGSEGMTKGVKKAHPFRPQEQQEDKA